MFFGKQPSVHHLKVFVCICISKIETHQRKLLPKGRKAVFTSNNDSSPAYILYDFVKKKIYRSRNMIFHNFTKNKFHVSITDQGLLLFCFLRAMIQWGPSQIQWGSMMHKQVQLMQMKDCLLLNSRYHRHGELLLQVLILLKEYLQHLFLIMWKWRFKILHSTWIHVKITQLTMNLIYLTPQTPTADNLQNITFPTPETSIHFYQNVLHHPNQENNL